MIVYLRVYFPLFIHKVLDFFPSSVGADPQPLLRSLRVDLTQNSLRNLEWFFLPVTVVSLVVYVSPSVLHKHLAGLLPPVYTSYSRSVVGFCSGLEVLPACRTTPRTRSRTSESVLPHLTSLTVRR